jgi:hypothetical protein
MTQKILGTHISPQTKEVLANSLGELIKNELRLPSDE